MQRMTFRGTPGRAVVYLIVLGLVGVLMGWAVGKAVGAPAPAPATEARVVCATTDGGACRDPNRKARKFKRKFHHGDLGNANGFNPDRLFKHPRKVRRVIVRRMARMLRASRAAGLEVAGGGFRLRARGIYTNMVRDTPCSTPFSSREFNAMSGPFIPRDCDMMDASELVSTKRLVQGLGVTACVGGVAVTLLTPAGRAAGGALKFWGASFQMTGCTTMAFLMGME